jgi:uncharacterized cupredoxin-like copper-binding protein
MRKIAFGLVLVLAGCGGQGARPRKAEPEPGPETVEVVATEYEFQGIPAELPAGETTFSFANEGEEEHQLGLALITSDLSVEEILQLPPPEEGENIEEVGATGAGPGGSGEFEADLEPGRYGYACFVETPDGESHAELGMFGEFTVA